ncbi:uncharacterized protein BT62DRAFT_995440 [Guyanagaster necrorhizus]|uniref:Uncharacterized protein n=1 Tax=Guyanagaster necrorhizus TaxID=856835 RepID=A0A9P7VQ67_9AGAR|nr:uncharacterized protein BT62DRAFT_995440 [Guyanagaster necrorhizus MCA 3950]KAG7444450.1 hypothetical protein BT62DRAFT_995440 [Guyanagaster necrorhizus MCA 3950]
MATPFYTFNSSGTSINYSWPEGLTGLERIALASQGDLQRVLSAFFARSIQIVLVYSHTQLTLSPDLPKVTLELPNPQVLDSVSPEHPITQTRKVLLRCAGKTVCTATSTIHMKSPRAAHLVLIDKYPIGQTFLMLGRQPDFELLSVEFGRFTDKEEEEDAEGEQLWRKYRLSVESFEAEILEVFPSRDMFSRGTDWLFDSPESGPQSEFCVVSQIWITFILFVVLFMVLVAISLSFTSIPADFV